MTADIETLAARHASTVAKEFLGSARRGGTEADFRREVAHILENASAHAGLNIIPRDEFSVARGRVDSVYNRLVLEYKRPGILKSTNRTRANQAVIQQVKDYILDVAKRERREAHRLAGVATDGFFYIFVRRVGEGWSVDDPLPVNPSSTERFLRLLFSLSAGAALVPENLIEDFGPNQWRARTAVRAMYRALASTKHLLVSKLFEQWRLFFSEVTDYKEWAERIESKPEFRAFVASLWTKQEIRHLDAAKVFFVLHTYYALLIKLVASLAAARFAGGASAPLSGLAAKEGNELRDAFTDLERGGLFREYGIRNFLEGDFFGWYLAAWNDDIEDSVSKLVVRLSEYDPGTLELAPENARDLLKKLYHYLLPREIRHDLGEYYTPDWLAERLIIQTLGKADLGNVNKRVLDPACGSGTFLVILIKYIKARSTQRKMNAADTLDLILRNVVGFDLNPLAVIAARTNYLLALGDLLKARKGDIDIPVYQCDSVLTPSRGTNLFDGNIYPLKTSVGIFRVPAIFAERERMDTLANVLDEAVESGIGAKPFLNRLSKAARLEPEEEEVAEKDLRNLYQQLRELHEQGVNGVWARIIKNAFAPIFLEPCHYIVGNPPWVNWESLPDDYRLQTKILWEHYGLFPHGGMDTILGKGKKDISMLMTYVSVDRYLQRGGKLGFVLSQSLFKTSGAGQGFRRFLLPDKTPFGPMVVEDMMELKPFEGATNRTAVGVFAKGRAIRYPVSYQYWKKRGHGRGSAIAFDTPYEEVTKEKVTFRAWHAEPVEQKDKTSPWITARRRALQALHNVLGGSPYSAHEGSNTGGANGIYWVEIVGKRPGGLAIISNITEGARRKVPNTQAAVETDLLYPLLRGRDIKRWRATPAAHILMTQNPETRRGIAVDIMECEYPKAHSYLSRFEEILRSRSAFRRYFRESDAYWTMFNVSPFTFSPWKVVWREVANEIDAAVVNKGEVIDTNKTVVPDHTCILVECETSMEAHYICALINSSPARLAIRNYIVLHPDPHVLNNVNIPKFSRTNQNHVQLAQLSESAHKATGKSDTNEVKNIEEEVDRLAAKLWELSKEELKEIKRSLEEG
ncbi:MAG: N-6 DNA methylase [Deltaproteobacteria bacterium]|nr:N-6 DNA methylase [Deltaproteobacteria bacterium]